MKRYLLQSLMALGLAALVPQGVHAQEPTQVTGQVTATGTGQPITGVQVQVKGTTIGTLTDASGRYSIRVPAGRTDLTFSFIGYRTVDAAISGSTVNVTMDIEAIGLEGVVVTALGITREKRELGYSAQGVSGATVTTVPQTNAVSALTGNVAGVNITSASVPGGSARIIIRGNKSIAGSNEPLFIVDGMPISNVNYGADYRGGKDRGNAAADIDPNSIESITVLKGPNAAAIYGSLAANGAVVITTKSGSTGQGRGISASVGTTFETPLRLPKYQNLYGQGAAGEFRYFDGLGNGLNDDVDESWGPRLDGRLIDQFTGTQQPWVAHPNNVRDFFELGRSNFITAAVARAGTASNVRLAVSNTNQNTMAPGNTLNTTNISLRGGTEMGERLSANASVSYMHRDAKNRPGIGYADDNIMQQFVWFGRQTDMKALKANYLREDGTQLNWNSNYHDNPYWMQLVNGNQDSRDRVFGSIDLNYKVTDWATAMVRVGQDYMQNFIKSKWAIGTQGQFPEGGFAQTMDRRVQRNLDVLLTGSRNVTSDLVMTASAGGAVRTNEWRGSNVTVGKLNAPWIYSLRNAGETPNATEDYDRKQVNSLLGTLSASYKGYLSVEATGRNDWSSTLPAENRSYFYPSISSALVFTDAFGVGGSFLSSGKIRASWAQVGNDTDPYRLYSVYNAQDPFNANPAFSAPTVLLNPNLKPEQTNSVEFGTDLGFFNERLGFVVTYYDSKTKNQILSVAAPASSGATSQNINAGSVRNYGIELQMNATPVQADNGFRWDMTLNFDQNRNKVLDLYTDPGTGEKVPAAVLQSLSWGLQVQARVGEPYGAFYGAPYKRDKATGKFLVNAAGVPQRDAANLRVLGNYNPDWGAGLRNTFAFKNLDLSVLIDGKMGGDIYSSTIGFGRYAGVLLETLEGRETHFESVEENGKTVIKCDGILVDGFYQPGTMKNGVDVSGQKNETRVCPDAYHHGLFQNAEAWIFDASFMKLREVRLGYRMPQSFVNRLGFTSMNVAVVGKNLWLWSKVPHIDPETAYSTNNVQGLEHGQFPSARSIGFTVSVQP
jgi:TonB-linked SusC/RagA family outer membrane protein